MILWSSKDVQTFLCVLALFNASLLTFLPSSPPLSFCPLSLAPILPSFSFPLDSCVPCTSVSCHLVYLSCLSHLAVLFSSNPQPISIHLFSSAHFHLNVYLAFVLHCLTFSLLLATKAHLPNSPTGAHCPIYIFPHILK